MRIIAGIESWTVGINRHSRRAARRVDLQRPKLRIGRVRRDITRAAEIVSDEIARAIVSNRRPLKETLARGLIGQNSIVQVKRCRRCNSDVDPTNVHNIGNLHHDDTAAFASAFVSADG